MNKHDVYCNQMLVGSWVQIQTCLFVLFFLLLFKMIAVQVNM